MNLEITIGVDVPELISADVVVVGSGPAGSAAALQLAKAGLDVVVVEEGSYQKPETYKESTFQAFANLYRDMGATITSGSAPMPYLQGRAVGGTSVVNGAISWRLPRDVYDGWVAEDPAIGEAFDWETMESALDEVEANLNIKPTGPEVAGPNNLLMAKGADAMGLEHRPIRRNVRGCQGLGRCLQGCPNGNKASMERSYLVWAQEAGARIISQARVERIETRPNGVIATDANGRQFRVRADRVVVAASAIQSPLLLMKSGLKQGPVGEHFQAHPGVSMAGYFPQKINVWQGATQGHEVIGLRKEGIKFEALGFDRTVAATRLKSVGSEFNADLETLDHWAHWGAAIRAETQGRVRRGFTGPRVSYNLIQSDIAKIRRGLAVLAEMMLLAGADYVTPGIHGFDAVVSTIERARAIEEEAPLDAKCYAAVMTHMFGTCRMGSNPKTSVVDTNFEHHHARGVYVVDSSVFPTNTGVNPQTSIIALATIAGRVIARRFSTRPKAAL